LQPDQIIPSLRGTPTGDGRCCGAALPGLFEDRGGGAGLLGASLGGLLCSFDEVCAVVRPNLGEASGGESARLGCGDIRGGSGGALEDAGCGVRERIEEELGAGERGVGGGDLTGGVGIITRGVGIAFCCLTIGRFGSAWNVVGACVLSLGFSIRSSLRRKRKSRPYSWSNLLL